MCGSTLFLLGARASSGVSTGRPSGSVTRKHKCLIGGVRPVVPHESEEPRRSNTPGSFLGKCSRHPRQSTLIGEGGCRLASSRPAALSVSEGPIGIPVLFCVYGAQKGVVPLMPRCSKPLRTGRRSETAEAVTRSQRPSGGPAPPLKCALLRMAAVLQGGESSINPLWRGECVFLGGTREPSFFVRPVTQVVVQS